MNPQLLRLLKKAQSLSSGDKPLNAVVTYMAFLAAEPGYAGTWLGCAGQLIRLELFEIVETAGLRALQIQTAHPCAWLYPQLALEYGGPMIRGLLADQTQVAA